jgi:predicted anti-sigma-YlaC factor YlaD
MSACTEIRERFSAYLEGDLEAGEITTVENHLEECSECRETLDSLRDILEISSVLADLQPPAQLKAEVADSPCRRWLGLLFSAIDREISEANLDRLFQHLEDCPSCRSAWGDLSLIHQVSDALEPPHHLLARCLRPRRPFSARKVLGKRTATAAAYSLALLASLAIGNPVTLARYEASTPIQQVSALFENGVSGATQTGRSEARVMLWRALNLGQRAVDAARSTWSRWTEESDTGETADIDDSKETQS